MSERATPKHTGLFQPAFLLVAAILLTFGITVNTSIGYLELFFKKERVELTRPLESLPARMGSWVQVTVDQPLPHEMQEELGTDIYVFRKFVNSSAVGPEFLSQLESATLDGRNEILAKEIQKNPSAFVDLAVTYYTGMVDTVAHIPDRCVIADGYQPRPGGYLVEQWNMALSEPVELRYINFEDQTGKGRVDRNVAYFFQANGEFVSDPVMVRKLLQNLRERYGYYAKIELMIQGVSDPELARTTMQNFLSATMPQVVQILPDWEKARLGPAPGIHKAQ